MITCKNFIKAELFRIFKIKATLVCVIITVLLGVLDVVVVRNSNKEIFGSEILLGKSFNENLWYVMVAFAVCFLSKEYSRKTMRLTVSKSISRKQIFICRYIVLCIMNAFFVFISFICKYVFGGILYGIKFKSEDKDVLQLQYYSLYNTINELNIDGVFYIKFIFLMIFAVMIVSSIEMFIISVLHGKGISTVILIAVGMSNLLFVTFADIFKHTLLTYYGPTMGISKLLYTKAGNKGFTEILLVMLCYLIISLFFGIRFYNKQDI